MSTPSGICVINLKCRMVIKEIKDNKVFKSCSVLERFDDDNFIYCYDGIFVKLNDNEGDCKVVHKESVKNKRDFQGFFGIVVVNVKERIFIVSSNKFLGISVFELK